MLLIVETPVFTRQVALLVSDEEYRAFQERLVANPEAGSLIPGGGGIRKIRMSLAGRGKRGWARVIYYWQARRDTIYMLLAYAKVVKTELSPREIRVLRDLVKALH